MASSSSDSCVLFQTGDKLLDHKYVDEAGNVAFTLEEFQQTEDPNRVVRLVRDKEWVQQHPTVLGPDRAHFYLGPDEAMHMGYLVYGSGTSNLQLLSMLRPGRKEGSISRYWRGKNNVLYKWKVTALRMECLHRGTRLAVWEVSSPDKDYYAKLTISPNAMPLVTELMATLVLNQMALGLTWPTLPVSSTERSIFNIIS